MLWRLLSLLCWVRTRLRSDATENHTRVPSRLPHGGPTPRCPSTRASRFRPRCECPCPEAPWRLWCRARTTTVPPPPLRADRFTDPPRQDQSCCCHFQVTQHMAMQSSGNTACTHGSRVCERWLQFQRVHLRAHTSAAKTPLNEFEYNGYRPFRFAHVRVIFAYASHVQQLHVESTV